MDVRQRHKDNKQRRRVLRNDLANNAITLIIMHETVFIQKHHRRATRRTVFLQIRSTVDLNEFLFFNSPTGQISRQSQPGIAAQIHNHR